MISEVTARKDLRSSFKRGLIKARAIIRRYSPIVSGDLRSATSFTDPVMVGSGYQSILGIDNTLMKEKYGAYVVTGTGIYGKFKTPVVPKREHSEKKTKDGRFKPASLRFKLGDKVYFRRSVKGMKPNNYFKKGYDENKDLISAEIMEGMKLKITNHLRIAR